MKSPVQLVVKSKEKPRSFTTLVIPGRGSGRNVYYLPEELSTDYVVRMEQEYGFISIDTISDKENLQ